MDNDKEMNENSVEPRQEMGRGKTAEQDTYAAPQSPCFVVGIGASGGGHGPLEHIFTTIPVDCNLSFVVIMHIPAEGPSFLSDLIRRYTSMEVLTAKDGVPLLPNTVHVIPSGVMLTVEEGRLRLIPGSMHHPIDRFFASLAADCGKRAIAVLLSGFGLDGAEGVKRIKEGGGLVLVQEPGTAVNPSMPQNAIATGAADFVLPMEDIPAKIAEIARGHCHLLPRACLTTTLDEELAALFAILKARTGHDFSSYKRNTILRRIERRMTVNDAGGIRKYLAILEANPQEAQALCQEILIGVTSFFRDPEAFELLQSNIIPRLFADRDPEAPVRIWHACCATGEEAYSVAMLIQEHLEKESRKAGVQIFATDIDEAAVAQARAGLYFEDIGPEVGEERLKTFFTRCDGRWQVAKRLREMIVFAHHSIIKDPPFSRLDLLVCRNFLIYLDPEMQKRLISLFHMVLKPGGFLFLGAAESIGRNFELFSAVDKKWKIFQRLESGRREETFFPFTSPTRKLIRNTPPKSSAEEPEPTPGAAAERLLVERYSPPCVIVNEKLDVLHISTKTQRYMEIPVGEPTMDILRMAREELRPALRAAIHKAFSEQKQVAFRGVKMAVESVEAAVNVLVEPLAADPAYGKLAMVILEPAPSPAVPSAAPGGDAIRGDESSKDSLIRQLEEQLRITHEQLQATSEQLETSNESFLSANEELMSINEEFQSTNEELQSTNEELETSKEELQALNEELVTVNSELQGTVEELNQSNSDMENLFASSGIAAIFLDRGLIIKRFSPAMAAIFNLVPADIGRPFRHLAGTIDWPDLSGDAQAVLEELIPVEREVTALKDGRSFLMRVLPYRTTDGRIDGIVVTLIDITELKRAEEEIRSAALFPLENPSPVLRIGRDGSILFSNRSAEQMLETWRADYGKDVPDSLLRSIESALTSGVSVECEVTVSGRDISFVVTPFPERGYANLYGRDITSRNLTEKALRRAKEEWERTFASVPDLITILDNEHRVLRVNEAMARRLGRKPEECVGLHCYEAVHGTPVPPDFCPHAKTIEDGCEHMAELHVDRLGGDFVVTTTPLLDEKGEHIGSVHIAHDITERKHMEDALRESEERFRTLLVNIPGAAYRCEIKAPWRISFISEGVEAITGQPASEFLRPNGVVWGDLVLAEDLPGVEQAVEMGVASKTPYEMEYRICHAEEGIRWVFEQGRAIYDSEGLPLFLDGVILNITARKRAEEALEAAHLAALQEKSRLEAVMEALPVGVAILDALGGHIRTNRTFEEVWGGPHPLPRTVDDYADYKAWWIETGQPVQPEEWASARAMQKGENVVGQLFKIERFDGTQAYIHNSAAPFHDAVGRIAGCAVAIMDITEQIETQEALGIAKEAAEAATRAKSQFLANMSHELRTPMTGVLGMLDFTLNTPLDTQQRDFIETAHMSGRSLLRILNDILDLTRIETGKLTIEENPFDLADCIAGVINILIPEARRKGLDLVSSVADDLPQTISGDKVRLQQVLTNLIGNAVKFTEAGKVAVIVRAGNETSEEKGKIIFTVSDTGIGIPADKKELIFQSFCQADDSHSRQYGGTGLGLAISREIVELMGGTITCESCEGKGSTFTFAIPLAEAGPESGVPAVPATAELIEHAVTLSDERNARLLIAEDDEVTRIILGHMLQQFKFDLNFAADGLKAVEMWENGEYDLIIMDGQMPGMDGFAATGVIRERERVRGGHIPIVAMTAHALREDKERCLAAGMDAYVSKPIDFKKCIEVIQGLLGRGRGQ